MMEAGKERRKEKRGERRGERKRKSQENRIRANICVNMDVFGVFMMLLNQNGVVERTAGQRHTSLSFCIMSYSLIFITSLRTYESKSYICSSLQFYYTLFYCENCTIVIDNFLNDKDQLYELYVTKLFRLVISWSRLRRLFGEMNRILFSLLIGCS